MKIEINDSMTLDIKTNEEGTLTLAEFDMVDSLLKPFRRANDMVQETRTYNKTGKYKNRTKEHNGAWDDEKKRIFLEDCEVDDNIVVGKKYGISKETVSTYKHQFGIQLNVIEIKEREKKWTPKVVRQFLIDSKLMKNAELGKKYKTRKKNAKLLG